MKRLKREEIIQIKSLVYSGLSLRKIHQKTGLALGTLQYHSLYKKKGRTIGIVLPESDFEIGEIIGAFAGDGSAQYLTNKRARKYFIKFYLSYALDHDYANYYLAN